VQAQLTWQLKKMTSVNTGDKYIIPANGQVGYFWNDEGYRKPLTIGHVYNWVPDRREFPSFTATYIGPGQPWKIGQNGVWQRGHDIWGVTVRALS
jgi:hypothetical protein